LLLAADSTFGLAGFFGFAAFAGFAALAAAAGVSFFSDSDMT
jgi:hypothetical protein